jgi:meckelin
VANVSVFILKHAQYGYYIHGKSPNGTADTNLKEMVMGFEKEEKDLVAKRGLLPDRQNQVFSISITNKLRNQYSKVMQPLYEVCILFVYI